MTITDVVRTLTNLGISVFVEEGKLKTRSADGALTPEVIELIKGSKQALIDYLVQAPSEDKEHPAIVARGDRQIDPLLSYSQQRLWVLDQIDGGSAHYNLPGALRLSGTLNEPALNRALHSIIERHESLRTCFEVGADGEPRQAIKDAPAFAAAVTDLSHLPAGEQQMHVAERVAAEAGRVFDLRCDLMLRAALLKLSGDEHILLVTMHHIASDGWSMGIFVKELSALYGAYAQGRANPLAPLAIQYADYAQWQRNWLQGDVLDRQLAYWTTQLADLPVAHSLPLDHPRPPQQTFAGAIHASRIDAATARELLALCQAQGATLFMGLHAAFSALLARYSNETDIVVGSPIANREQAEIAPLIGFFINTLVLRSDLSANPSFTELLAQSKRMLLDAYAHQQVPFEQIVERLRPERNLAHSALFQVMLTLQNNEERTLTLPGMRLSPVDQGGNVAKYDLSLSVSEAGQGLDLHWEYNTDLFDSATVARMAAHFGALLTALVKAPQESVFKAAMLGEAERRQLLVEWNSTQAAYPQDKCLHELFEEQAARTPDAPAVIADDGDLSYGELNAKANRLAHYLRGLGVQPDDRIAICAGRGAGMVVAMLATLKAGAGYVPLDPAYPADRLAYMLKDSAPKAVLTHGQAGAALPDPDAARIDLDTDAPRWAGLPAHDLERAALPRHLAYIIYTSGSTGMPKGVMIEHGNAVNFVCWAREAFAPAVLDKTLFATSLNFDLAVYECFVPLSMGGSTTIVANALALLNQGADVSLVNTVPSAIEALVDAGAIPATVKLVNLAGEALKRAVVERLFATSAVETVCNLYGPSETTTYSTWVAMPRAGGFAKHIGRPIANTTVYLLDAHGQLVPPGVPGEIYIGGAGVARGYLNRPDLSAERFLADRFAQEPQARMYRTGDLARYLPDGNIEYLGRIDHQVKIRGFRIELGEIEHALATHAQVSNAVVLAKEAAGGQRLVAYAVVEDVDLHGQLLVEELRGHLAQTLPEYMIPSALVLLAALPLTPNGKLDRKALPEPDLAQAASHIAPRTELELALCEIWQEVLGVEQAGVTDNFFQLGGHSLLATRLVAQINQRLGLALPLKALFQSPTPAGLAQILSQLDRGLDRPALLPVARGQDLSLSYSQQRLWVLDQIDGGSAHYNLPGALRLSGTLDLAALNRALHSILERHESLRTCFEVGADGQPRQVVKDAPPFAAPVTDLSHLPAGEQQLHVAERVAEEAGRVFDLRCDLMLRAALLKLAGDEHILLVTMHHIASDGWSIGIFIQEFSALYGAYVQGRANPLAPLAIQYADYAQWQRNWLQGDVLDRQLAYWTTQLADLPVAHSLPLDHPRPLQQTFAGAIHASRIDAATASELLGLCQAQGATLFMGLHAAFAVLLARYSNETDIVVGSPIANREQAEIAPLIGFFVNTLVLRSDLSANPAFTELLAQSKGMLLDAYAHQQVPFEQIVERLRPQRNLAHSALFQVMLILQNNEESTLALPGMRLSPVDQDGNVAKYDLSLSIGETGQGLELRWEYNTDLFKGATIARMAAHFGTLLTALVKAPQESVFKAAMLGEAERRQLLAGWNGTQSAYPQDKCLHELFEEQAAANPEAVAVVFEGQQLSYGALNTKANQLAHYLVTARQVKPDTLVGICLERSLEMVIAILGILKAGAAYVPLDPDYPPARLAYVMDDAKLGTVLTQRALAEPIAASGAQALCLDDASVLHMLAGLPDANIAPHSLGLHARHLAYAIYTSGSTGNSKGVMVEHHSVVNLAFNIERLDLTAVGRQWGWFASYAFDASLQGLTQLALGRPLSIISDQRKRDPSLLAELLPALAVIDCTPMMAEAWLAAGLGPRLPHLLIGGEAISPKLWAQLQDWQTTFHKKAVNVYGPTECTVDATACLIDGEFPHIGKMLANSSAYVLNEALMPSGVGIAGELYIGGAGLARGYLNRPELTSEKFIVNPFHDAADPASSCRLYKTGDLVRWLADGNLDYLGRIDHQVKIRGFRIELGEIEHALASHGAVSEAVVLARDFAAGDKRLVAYVVTQVDESEAALVDDLRRHLAVSLPQYMVPAAFVLLASLPLTPNGKLDRKALPEPGLAQAAASYVAPRTEMELALCAIWQEVLGVEQVGVTDNFFQLGGHSLLAVVLVARIRQRMAIEVPLRVLFTCPTVGQFAGAVGAGRGAFPNLVPIRAATSEARPPLFLIHPGEGEVGYAMALAPSLPADLPVYGLAASGFLDGEAVLCSVADMAALYIRGMREVQAAGPYHVAGWSAGGTIAYEIARQLIEAGQEVAFLGLIDTASDYGVMRAHLSGVTSGDADAAALLALLPDDPADAAGRDMRALVAAGKVEAALAHGRRIGMFPAGIDDATLRRHVAVRAGIRRALAGYAPAPLPIPLSLFVAQDEVRSDPALGWPAMLGDRVSVAALPGTHYSIMDSPQIEQLGTALAAALLARREAEVCQP